VSKLDPSLKKVQKNAESSASERVAIIGMACLFPNSPNLAAYWDNIFNGRDCLRTATEKEWGYTVLNVDKRAKPDRDRFGNIYARRGGFITELADFDPLSVGVMPKTVEGSDPDQMLALKVACEAMADAGYQKKAFDPTKAEVILGRTSAPGRGSMNMIQHGQTIGQIVKVASEFFPDWTEDRLEMFAQELRNSLAPCNSDTIPGAMPNILAARVAGRLGFHGRSLVLDSACASSLIAVEIAVDDLRSGKSDLALAGGVFVNSLPCFTQMFCGLEALSATEQVRPFDDSADGTLLGEGIGIVVLKRLEDALRDGDRIYASIAGIASSSDGKGTSMLAPAAEGEALAISRAYADANVSPLETGLVEAHGTGTKSGDIAELKALQQVFDSHITAPGDSSVASSAGKPKCAIGSVKAMIGHAQAASGIAGLIKAALSLYHKVLPTSIGAETPNSHFDWQSSPLYLSNNSRPWIHPLAHPELSARLEGKAEEAPPRRASVSAFGFGGVNAHAVLEECRDDYFNQTPNLLQTWPTELFLFGAKNAKGLQEQITHCAEFLAKDTKSELKDIAYSLCEKVKEEKAEKVIRLAIVAANLDDLREKLAIANAALSHKEIDIAGFASQSIYFQSSDAVASGRLAFVLPGLGSAYPNMLAELCVHFPEIRAIFDFVDYVAKTNQNESPCDKVFPRAEVGSNNDSVTVAALAAMDNAVVTVLMAEWALFVLLIKLGIVPDVLVGCSTGEFAALTMGGAADILGGTPTFYHLSTSVANAIPKEKLADLRSVKVKASFDQIEPLMKKSAEVFLSADLSNKQVILTGSRANIDTLVNTLESKGMEADYLPVAIPYHTALVKGMVATDRTEVDELELSPPAIESWSCSIAAEYPQDPDATKLIMTELFSKPILLRKTIGHLYDSGVTKFVEVGPKDTLTPVVSEILGTNPHLAVASNKQNGSALSQVQHMLATLFSSGVDVNAQYLFARRQPISIDFGKPAQSRTPAVLNLAYPEIMLKQGWQERLQYDPAKSSATSAFSAEPSVESTESSSAQPEAAPFIGPDAIVTAYLSNMSAFHENLLSAQNEVMLSYLGNNENTQFESQDVLYPLLEGARFVHNEEALIVDLAIDLNSHRYLLDHAIGGTVRQWAGFGERVHLLPLTVALELMAEVSSFYFPQVPVVELRNVRASRRIRIGAEGSSIRIIARQLQEDQPAVQVAIYRGPESNEYQPSDPLMLCEVVFGERPQLVQAQHPSSKKNWQKSRYEQKRLYAKGAMFHGERMQSVRTVKGFQPNENYGLVAARPAQGWFASDEMQCPHFLLDPLLLDNATQLVLFHLFDLDEPVHALLPFMIDSVQFFTDLPMLQGDITVHAQFNSLNARGTDANVTLLSEDGTLLARFNSIKSRRITLEDSWRKLIENPAACYLSKPFATAPDISVIEESLLPSDEGTLSWCADYLLAPRENQIYETLPNLRRRRDWLLGRIAAKDAVRRKLSASEDMSVTYADIEIHNGPEGAPFVYSANLAEAQRDWKISITHKDGIAYAFATDRADVQGVGIDLEMQVEREAGFEDLAFAKSELESLENAQGGKNGRTIAAAWAAKEAAAKAIKTGFEANPKNFQLTSIDISTNRCAISVNPQLLQSHDSNLLTKVRTDSMTVELHFLPNHVLAVCII